MHVAFLLSMLLGFTGESVFAQEKPERELLGGSAAFGVRAERIEVAQGTSLFTHPSSAADVAGSIDSAMELTIRERRGDWVQVEYEGYLAWLRPDLLGTPDLTSGIEQQIEEVRQRELERQERVAVAKAQHPQRFARARALMPEAREEALGPFLLLSELKNGDPLLDRLEAIAVLLEQAFLNRLGLPAQWAERVGASEVQLVKDGHLPEVDQVILFSNREQYGRYLNDEGSLGGLDLGGHASSGTAALFVGGLDRQGVASSFVHEATHLVSSRLFGGRLPDWLEEGLAEDLAWSRRAPDGSIEYGTLQVARRRNVITRRSRSFQVWLPGELAQVCEAARRWQMGFPDPLTVANLDFDSFVDPERRVENYTFAGMLTRAVLEGRSQPLKKLADELRDSLNDRWREFDPQKVSVPVTRDVADSLKSDLESQLGELRGACRTLERR